MTTVAKSLLPVLLLLAVGCDDNKSKPTTISEGPWLPLSVGNRWTYQVTDLDGTVSVKIQGVTAQEPVGGTGPLADMVAFKLVTGDKFNDKSGDVSYQGLVDSRVVRFRELSVDKGTGAVKKEEYFDPPKLRIDETPEHTGPGTSWPESYADFLVDTPKATSSDGGMVDTDGGLVTTSAHVIDVWKVTSASESVTVPAGTFDALVVQRLGNSGSKDKTFWFVRGVGKIKEAGTADQTEELTSYSITP